VSPKGGDRIALYCNECDAGRILVNPGGGAPFEPIEIGIYITRQRPKRKAGITKLLICRALFAIQQGKITIFTREIGRGEYSQAKYGDFKYFTIPFLACR
jgi:hypothetical protein